MNEEFFIKAAAVESTLAALNERLVKLEREAATRVAQDSATIVREADSLLARLSRLEAGK
jgi:ubiquinone biosynthesis protein UbiJ